MTQNPWKRGHAGVPREWRQIGEGGNAVVWRVDDFAVKRLKDTASAEARTRFHRESSLMMELKGDHDLRVIPVIEVRRREEADEIVMLALDGSLEGVMDRFRCQPRKAASALAPIVDTLAKLSARDPRIHHRDLKPSNILYKTTEMNLYLGDFGCAYLAGNERITPDRRAIGAWAYRPPEYSSGRVEDVDEKGDVFSLGKVLWSMINGSPHVTFPGPVWFLPEYDFTLTCPEGRRTAEAMYVIARCCSIRPDRRPTLLQLKAMLEDLASDSPTPTMTLRANALKREQEQEVEYAQRQAIARPFVTRLTEDMKQALVLLHASNPGSLLLDAWLTEWNRIPNRNNTLIEQVVIHESDAPVINVLRRKEALITRFFPEGMNGPLRFSASFGRMNEPHLNPRLTVEVRDSGMFAIVEGLSDATEETEYSAVTLVNFLSRAIDAA